VEQTRKQEIQEILDAAGSDRDRLEACQKLEETEREMKSEVAPRLSHPDHQFEQIKRRGQRALFDKSPERVKEDLGVPQDRETSDFADPVIVKGMDFASAVTTRQVKGDKNLTGVKKIGDVNEKSHQGVRRVMIAGGAPPETLPPAGDIRDVQRRLEKQRAKLIKKNGDD
jgi:DNA-damage-inducible protein D